MNMKKSRLGDMVSFGGGLWFENALDRVRLRLCYQSSIWLLEIEGAQIFKTVDSCNPRARAVCDRVQASPGIGLAADHIPHPRGSLFSRAICRGQT
jgi:hypothetical protein